MSDIISLEPNNSASPEKPDNAPSPAQKLLDSALNATDNTPNSETAGLKERVLEQQIIEVLTTIYDPEIPVDIYELGLIYSIKVTPQSEVEILMTLTSPACPVAGTLPIEVENKIAAIPGVKDVDVEIVWEPPYSMEMMSEAARLQLGLL
jgi:FeS assembly SUF system protein